LIILARVNGLALTVLFGAGTLFGQGHHIEDVPVNPPQNLLPNPFHHFHYVPIALCLTKISILVFYLRVFPGKREKWMTWSTIVFVIAFGILIIIMDVRNAL
jgi:hypothetical protein